MKFKPAIATFLSAAALVASAAVNAASVEIKFFPGPVGGSGGYFTTAPMDFANDGISVTAQGQYTADGGATWLTAKMSSYADLGLAIRDGADQHFIDGSGHDERVLLAFSQVVAIEALKFTYVDDNDEFAIWTFDPSESLLNGSIDIPGSGGTNTTVHIYTLLDALMGNQFAIGAMGDDDDFKLYSVVVSQVPVPGTLGLLGLGLIGLGLVRRRVPD